MNLRDEITVVIPTSPIPSCPTTTLIEQTINSIRFHLPDVPILIQADGVRPEQEKFREPYRLYLEKLERLCADYHRNMRICEFIDFHHQAAMMKRTLGQEDIKTPLLFYVEHDLPLLPDPIDFVGMVRLLRAGALNQIRLHYWSQILDDHKYLMLDEKPLFMDSVPIVRTVQWSQHPHLARVDFYERLMDTFSSNCRTMIETKVYSLVQNARWDDYRCGIYAPEPNLRRITHTHGREEEPKWEEDFTF